MELRNCPDCGKVFTFISRNLCPACIEKEEASFNKVEEYLEENTGATISEISRATGVAEEKIIFFLRAGRLVPIGGKHLLECESCGKPISSGRFCAGCQAVLSSSLREAGASRPPAEEEAPLIRRPEPGLRQKGKMYTADRYRKTRR